MRLHDYGKWTRAAIWIENPLGITERVYWYSGYLTEEYIKSLFNISPYEKIDVNYQYHRFVVSKAEAYRTIDEDTRLREVDANSTLER